MNAAYIDHENKLLYVANAGDSRCIIGKKGKVETITRDHVPSDPSELERIDNAGEAVWGNKIMGSLSLSRGFGFSRFKDKKDLS